MHRNITFYLGNCANSTLVFDNSTLDSFPKPEKSGSKVGQPGLKTSTFFIENQQ